MPEYPFTEFCKHVVEITAILHENIVEGDKSLYATVGYVSRYMSRVLTDPDERDYKTGRFCLIMHFVSAHIEDFDTEDFAVYGSERVGGLVGEHLLRAVHHLLTQEPPLTVGPTPAEVMQLAKTFRDGPAAAQES